MNQLPEQKLSRLVSLAVDIDVLAFKRSRTTHDKDDLKQEMACRFLELPQGQTRAWYLSRLGDHAQKYMGRHIVDAPLDKTGRPILDRQTVAVGGLAELDRVHCRQRAA